MAATATYASLYDMPMPVLHRNPPKYTTPHCNDGHRLFKLPYDTWFACPAVYRMQGLHGALEYDLSGENPSSLF